jgi:hypothetical protein
MKRTTILSLALMMAALAVTSGCARATSSNAQARGATPGMADAQGPSGLSRESKGYLASDPP